MKALNFLNSLPKSIIPVCIDAGSQIKYKFDSVNQDRILIDTTREFETEKYYFEFRFVFYVDYTSRHEADCNNHDLELKIDRDFVDVKILQIVEFLPDADECDYVMNEDERVLIQDFIAKNICLVAN